MERLASFKVLGTRIQVLVGGSGYWIGRDGTLTLNTTLVPDNARFDLSRYQLVKVSVSQAAQAGTVGMRLDVVELWPRKDTAGLVNTYPPSVLTTLGSIQTINTAALFTFPVTANNQILNICRYNINTGTATTFATLFYQGGTVALQLFATTWSATAGDMYFEIEGLYDAVANRAN